MRHKIEVFLAACLVINSMGYALTVGTEQALILGAIGCMETATLILLGSSAILLGITAIINMYIVKDLLEVHRDLRAMYISLEHKK